MPVIILGGIYGGFFTPTEAATISVVYGFFAGMFIYKELTLEKVYHVLIGSAVTTATVLIICATGTVLGRVLTIENIPAMIADGILSFSSNRIVILMIMNLLLLVVGCLMDTTAAILILSPILYPIVAAVGVDVLHFGLIMVVNLAIGFVTPPVGINLFVASNIGEISFTKLARAIFPFIAVMLIGQMIITFVPPLTTFLPTFFMK